MKKTFMIALAGMMLFAFTQCGGGSKEFQESKKAMKEMTNALKEVTKCEDLEKAEKKIEEIGNKMDGMKFDEKDQMTKEEKEEFTKLTEEFMKLMTEKAELCN